MGFFDVAGGAPWAITVVDLESGEVVIHDSAGMGTAEDDLADLYEDASPRVLGFDGDQLYVRVASGNDVVSWNPRTGERTNHGDRYLFAPRDPGGGRALPAIVRHDRLVVPKDLYMSTQWGHLSPDRAVALMPVGSRTVVFEVDGGRRLPLGLPGRRFVLGGWTKVDSAFGIAFDRSPFGPHRVRLVRCRLSVQHRACRVLSVVRPPDHQLIVFPTGSGADSRSRVPAPISPGYVPGFGAVEPSVLRSELRVRPGAVERRSGPSRSRPGRCCRPDRRGPVASRSRHPERPRGDG